MSATPRAVTLVAHEIGTPGGMEHQLAKLATGLLARGYELTVVARACELPPHPGLHHVPVRGPRRPFSLSYPCFFVFGSLAVRRRARGLVHTTGALVFNRADVSTVHFCHRAFHARTRVLRASKRSPLYRLNARLADGMSRVAERYCYHPSRTRSLVAVSEGVAQELREFFPAMRGAVSVIPNGVDREAFAPDPLARERLRSRWGLGEDDLVALFVGGEWERKGLRYAIEAVARVPRWHLVVVGGGDAARFEGLATASGAGGRVRFVGVTRETAPYYACADAFLLPTAYEAFPLVVLEAAAAGLPLMLPRISGVEEILAEGRNGWFIERDAAVIAERLRELERDERLRRAMGEAARRASARFDWEGAVVAYDEHYAGLLPGAE
jgi:glycosyltransferase involved in cell wall biosynthesis